MSARTQEVECSCYVGPVMWFTEMPECGTRFTVSEEDPECPTEWAVCPKCGGEVYVEWPRVPAQEDKP